MDVITTEFEVFHPALEALMEMPMCADEQQAETLRVALNARFPGFQVRPVTQGREAIPAGSPVPTHISVHEGRKLMARHGQEVLVILAWSATGSVNMVTCGNSDANASIAFRVGSDIVEGLGLTQMKVIEDRRKEHQG